VETRRRGGAAARRRGGCVAPEELAPYLPAPPSGDDAADCLGAAQRAVAHFGARPVAGDGGIVLDFADVASDAAPEAAFAAPARGWLPGGTFDVPDSLHEARRDFFGVGAHACAACAFLGAVNLASVAWLRAALAAGFVPEGPLTPLLRRASAALWAYAVFFVCLPILRCACVAAANARVDGRNDRRAALHKQLQQHLDDPTSHVASKVAFARKHARNARS